MLPTKDNLLFRDWTCNDNCVYCQEPETVAHLFINCLVARAIWTWIENYNTFSFYCATIEEL